jgi:hypothetical protein
VTATEKAALDRLGFSPVQRVPPALVIPVWAPAGQRVGNMIRPDAPRLVRNRLLKYEWPAKAPLRLDVPPVVADRIGDTGVELWITEGPIKADALASAGAGCVVGLAGVWAWLTDTPLPDWEDVALRDRRVLLCFDSDAMAKPEVHKALHRLLAWLTNRGARAEVVYLPAGDGAKVGVDDFLAAGHPLADVEALAENGLRPLGQSAAPVQESFDDVPDEAGWAVLDDVAAYLARFVVFPTSAARDAVALWVAHTHAATAFFTTPRLAVISAEKESGKTRLLEVAEPVCRRPLMVVNTTPAALFRSVDAHAGACTVLFDEVDAIFGEKATNHEELRGLLNAGYRAGAKAARCVGDSNEVREFNAFAPVALAAIGDLPDTLMGRAVVVRMKRRTPGEPIDPFRVRRVLPVAGALRHRLAAWLARHADALADAEPDMPAGISDRAADVWEPLVSIADAAGGDWPERSRRACRTLEAARSASAPTVGVRLLADIRAAFGDDERVFSTVLVERLRADDEAPWRRWGKRGDGLDPSGLAWLLRPYGIESRQVRLGDETRKGYRREDFVDAWSRFLSTLPGGETPVTGETPQVSTTSIVSPVTPVSPPGGRDPDSNNDFDAEGYEAAYPELFAGAGADHPGEEPPF